MKCIHRMFLRRMPSSSVTEALGSVNRTGVPIPQECKLLHVDVEGWDLLLSYEKRDTTEMPVPLRHFYVAMYDETYPDSFEYVGSFSWRGYRFHLLEIK